MLTHEDVVCACGSEPVVEHVLQFRHIVVGSDVSWLTPTVALACSRDLFVVALGLSLAGAVCSVVVPKRTSCSLRTSTGVVHMWCVPILPFRMVFRLHPSHAGTCRPPVR